MLQCRFEFRQGFFVGTPLQCRQAIFKMFYRLRASGFARRRNVIFRGICRRVFGRLRSGSRLENAFKESLFVGICGCPAVFCAARTEYIEGIARVRGLPAGAGKKIRRVGLFYKKGLRFVRPGPFSVFFRLIIVVAAVITGIY
ncbi:MAG: hypothetical protein ACOCS6_00740, partial [Desulfosalsimonas sp.]